IGSVRFRAGTIELDATFTWKVRVGDVTRRTPVPLATSNPQLSAPMTGAVAQTLTLDVSNQQPQAVAAPVSVRVLCRNEAGLPVQLAARDVRERLGPATSVSVTVRFRSLCPDYVVAAQGTPAR
ncbi:MAG TPA: hypothetical protein VFZ17_09235, partial [Acidimicrobiia bacterium]|nr:hypothetical protein [Acidimicrobiia bacterium]